MYYESKRKNHNGRAHKLYNNFTRNRLMVSEYEKKEIYQYNKKIILADERRIGMREGIKKGKLESIKDEKYSIAKTLKQMNMYNVSLSKATGLSIEEIEKL